MHAFERGSLGPGVRAKSLRSRVWGFGYGISWGFGSSFWGLGHGLGVWVKEVEGLGCGSRFGVQDRFQGMGLRV